MSCGEFSDDEIRKELAHLGYHNVPHGKLEDFKKDLMTLISAERTKSNSLNSSITTEPERKDAYSQPQHYTQSEDVHNEEEDFTNHGSQWIGNRFYEDWHYHGEKESRPRPQTAPEQKGRQRRGKVGGYSSFIPPPPSASVDLERNHSCHRDDVSESGSESRCMKRKTSRKTPNGCRLVDESFTDTDLGVFEIYEKIKNLAMRECECGKSRPKSGEVEPPYRFKGKVNKYPSVVKSGGEPPHTRNLIKINTNDRFKMYQEMWKAQPAIGDNDRVQLRKAIHAKMLKHEDIKLKQKVYIPNMYVPPHEKKRGDLRWKVRQAFGRYELPEHGCYHEV